jgi:hypothetical protein
MGFPTERVDHINRDRLDCQRSNLRLATARENAQNTSSHKGSTSQYRGVYLHECGRWAATASVDGKAIYLGLHLTEEAAAETSATWRRLHMAGATN